MLRFQSLFPSVAPPCDDKIILRYSSEYINRSCARPALHLATPYVSSVGIAVALGAIVITIFIPIPQFYKLCKQRSSAGISCFTATATVVFSLTNVGAALITKWRQIEQCSVSGLGCMPNLLDLVQSAFVAFLVAAQLVIVVHYPPNRHKNARSAAAVVLFTAGVVWISCVCWSIATPCATGTLGFATALGYVGSFTALVQYVPQLHATWRHQGSGSLSLLSYALQTAGGYLLVYQTVYQGATPWPVWGPWLISTVMQNAVIASACFFDARTWRRRRLEVTLLADANATAPVRVDGCSRSHG